MAVIQSEINGGWQDEKHRRKNLKSSHKAFSEDGYNGVSTKRIAEKAGVNEVTIFRLFNTKSALLQLVIRHFAFEGNILEKVSKDLTGNLKEDLYIFANDYYMFLVNNIKMFRIQLREITEEGMTFTNSIDYVEYMTEYLAKKVDSGHFKGNPRSVSAEMIALILGLFTFTVYNSKLYTETETHDVILKNYVDNLIKLHCE